MRRIVTSCALAGAVACAILFNLSSEPVHAQSKAKAVKAVKTTIPSVGNADAISQEELKVYLIFSGVGPTRRPQFSVAGV